MYLLIQLIFLEHHPLCVETVLDPWNCVIWPIGFISSINQRPTWDWGSGTIGDCLRSYSRNWQSWELYPDLLMSCFDTFETRRPGVICSLIQLLWGISHVPGTVKWVPRRFPYLWVGVLGPVFRKDKVVLHQRHRQRQWTQRGGRGHVQLEGSRNAS